MIEINNLTSFAVDKKFLSTVAKNVLIAENREMESLSVAFVDADEIKKLNKKFRKKNKATDVLSFGNVSSFKFQVSREGLGEVVICPKVVEENSKIRRPADGNDFDKELAKILIHGILHLLGYDHEKTKDERIKMEEKEKNYLSALFKN